ncbi:hypothetical protein BS78_K305200 [Paspalum vaginatum]|uniref:Pectinesterase n=1 Tax=Paspalum vaginatum TaxID=158149 RepID=A0A9W7X9C8_9POAL|nr:hypothetical protein BS78_K305200 [Paspalum vaginatum]
MQERVGLSPVEPRGWFSEKLVVNKSRIHLVGKLASSTVVTWKGSWWSDESATAIHVVASDFVARNITFQNTYGEGAPGIAARVDGDRAAFYGCNFLSYQDTILDGDGRHYYQGCYIEGATDFIFGQGKAFFEKCHLHSIAGKDKVGAFTAQGRDAEWKNTGFSFVDCSLTGIGANYTILGRPWRNYARVVFARCTMSNSVRPEGWSDWKKPITHRTAFFGQFQCSGDGSKTNGRVPWAHNDLSAAEAAPYLTKEAWVDGNDWITN